MNLFRSEEHAKNWSLYDPVSADAIMLLADWALVFSGPLARSRLEPDYLSRVQEYRSDLFDRLRKLGKTGPFWQSGQAIQ
jgi:hypothetical protein